VHQVPTLAGLVDATNGRDAGVSASGDVARRPHEGGFVHECADCVDGAGDDVRVGLQQRWIGAGGYHDQAEIEAVLRGAGDYDGLGVVLTAATAIRQPTS
jgi:hypothetical protein